MGFFALEIVGIAVIGGEIGVLRTVLWLVGAMFAGGWLIRAGGAGFLPALLHAGSRGQDPFAAMWRAGRHVLAGMLLIFPGAISDVLALLLLLGAGLPRLPAATRHGGQADAGSAEMGRGVHRDHAAQRGAGDVIEGEFRRED
ncbi:MAG: FxsA family protein [Pseudomonadota bacterium]